jgi:bacterioferritin
MENKEKTQKTSQAGAFFTDVTELRRRAREHILQGAVTSDYAVNLETTLKLLNEALATELVCVLRYKSHYYMAEGIHAKSVAEEFLEHSKEEEQHADWIAARMRQLGGKPDFNPSRLLTRSHAEYQEGETLLDMVKEDLIAERVAIESYREMIQYFADKDPTTRRLLESILAQEEEHAEDMSSILTTLDPRKSPAIDTPNTSKH